MMRLATIPGMVGGHLGGWRHRDAFGDDACGVSPASSSRTCAGAACGGPADP